MLAKMCYYKTHFFMKKEEIPFKSTANNQHPKNMNKTETAFFKAMLF